MKVGILALQGAFIEHKQALDKLGVSSFEIRQKKDIEQSFDALIILGGESMVIGKLLHKLKLFESLKNMIENGLPTFGTCAGMILLVFIHAPWVESVNSNVEVLCELNGHITEVKQGKMLATSNNRSSQTESIRRRCSISVSMTEKYKVLG